MSGSRVIQALEAELGASATLTAPVLGAALAKHRATLDDVAPWVRFSAENYTRNLITKTQRWELRLLCWRHGQGTSLHGHGDAACAFTILRGTATETVLGARDRTWTPGAVVEESTPLVHQVSNLGGDALVSLHAYSPPLPADAPSPATGRTVVVVGGGLSGVAAAYHLLLRLPRSCRVLLIERGPQLGRGVAYGVDSPVFRLNVPASRMSIDPALPADFVGWAEAAATPHAFLSRAQYGRYIEHSLARAIRSAQAKLRVVRGNAVAVSRSGVVLADGRELAAEVVVLATGLEPRRSARGLSDDPRIIDAWDECALATLPPRGRILLLGSGLTAVDVVTLLHERGFEGKIDILSARGLLPRPHLEPMTFAAPLGAHDVSALPGTLRGLSRWLRARASQGGPWQEAVDALRPHLSAVWGALRPADRARFVRHLRPYWDVLRHRMPADAHALVERLKGRGALSLRAGRAAACVGAAGGVEVTVQLRGGAQSVETYDAVVRCLGPALTRSELEEPLVSSLLESGAALLDPAGLGIVTNQTGRLEGHGGSGPQLYALGALRRASAWETTSVPDISRHAAEIAERIAASLRG